MYSNLAPTLGPIAITADTSNHMADRVPSKDITYTYPLCNTHTILQTHTQSFFLMLIYTNTKSNKGRRTGLEVTWSEGFQALIMCGLG